MIEDPQPRPARRAVIAFVATPPERADEIAGTLVGEALAACVNVISGVRSTYRWNGEIAREEESLLVLKTEEDLIEAIRARLASIHPHEVFELVAIEVAAGNPRYLDWVALSVREA